MRCKMNALASTDAPFLLCGHCLRALFAELPAATQQRHRAAHRRTFLSPPDRAVSDSEMMMLILA